MKINKSKFFHRLRKKGITFQALLISLLLLVIILSRFIYIFFLGENDVKGDFFGFEWLSFFLWDFGSQCFTIFTGLLLWYSTIFHTENKFKKVFRLSSYLIILIGFFYVFWIFLDNEKFNETFEVVGSLSLSFLATFSIVFLMKFLNKELMTITELKSKIRFVMHKMIVESVKNKHIINKERWKEEIVDPTLDKLDE